MEEYFFEKPSSMPSKVFSCAATGLHSRLIEVEVDILGSLNPALHIVGLGDTSIQEAKERIRSAFKNSGLEFPRKRKVVNLAPADLRKCGPLYDLPIAVAIFAACSESQNTELKKILSQSLFVGELSLDGHLRSIPGILLIAAFAKERGFKRLFLPSVNAEEAALIEGIDVMPLIHLKDCIEHLLGQKILAPYEVSMKTKNDQENSEIQNDLQHIIGQNHAKNALEISAAGGHNILLVGPPGSGKTMLARAIQSILPRPDFNEALEITKIYSLAGLIEPQSPLITKAPFRSVHHTASGISIIGGGRYPKPGEITLAHKGVLFLDECAEFPQFILDYLRQPLEDNCITINRATFTVQFPAEFILVAAMNPCSCGFHGDLQHECLCTPEQIQRYKKKISGPLRDRIDLIVDVPRIPLENLVYEKDTNYSSEINKRIQIAREIQRRRFNKHKISLNSKIPPEHFKTFCDLDFSTKNFLYKAAEKLNLSARAYSRILKTARTIADLNQNDAIKSAHIAQALQYRARN